MFDEHVVALAVKYLAARPEQAPAGTLVEMLEYVDYYNRTIANEEEVNEALRRRPGTFVIAVNGRMEFSRTGEKTTISADEVMQAYKDYSADFQISLEKLRAQS